MRRKYNKRKQRPWSPIAVARLLVWHLDLARADGVDDIVWGLAVDCAADGLRGAEDLLCAVREVLGERL